MSDPVVKVPPVVFWQLVRALDLRVTYSGASLRDSYERAKITVGDGAATHEYTVTIESTEAETPCAWCGK